jgi:hypothetical protein
MEQELKQEEATVEQPKEEISKETPKVTPPEEKKTSEERTYSESEFRKMQSMKDIADAKAQKYEKQLDELRKIHEQQRLEARKKEIADLEGDTDAQAQARRKHQLEDELTKLEDQKLKDEGAVQRKYDQAIELAQKHNLSLADARELMKAETPREMELMAQVMVAEQATVKEPPKEETKQPFLKPDSGTSDAGTDSDEAFINRWNSGEEPATKENMERVNKIIKK